MKKIATNLIRVIIYSGYLYLLTWQIYYLNQVAFWNQRSGEMRETLMTYMPSIVVLLFAFLLYIGISKKQIKILIFDAFFASSLLLVYNTIPSISFGLLLAFFALVISYKQVYESK